MEKTELLPGNILSNLQTMNPDSTEGKIREILADLEILDQQAI